MQPTRQWVVEELRAAILQYIKIQENVYRYSSTQPSKGHFTTQVYNNKCCFHHLNLKRKVISLRQPLLRSLLVLVVKRVSGL